MSEYRIETHMHTVHTSACARLEAAALAEGYAKAGFVRLLREGGYAIIGEE